MFGKFLLVFVHENILSNVERDAVFSDGWVSISVVCVRARVCVSICVVVSWK